MKAWLLKRPAPIEQNPLEINTVAVPAPGNGEVLIKVSACGVCHTDLHIIEGELTAPKLPVIPGHQAVGKIAGTGEGASPFKTGDRVGVPWLHWTCGACRYCSNGLENLCENASFTGFHLNGGFAEYICAKEDFVYRMPENFDDVHAAPLLCAGIIGYRALRLSGIKSGGRLGLFGFGASAHIALQIAVHMGAEVFVFSRSEEHRDHAMELGAGWAGTVDERPPDLLTAAISFAPAGSIVPHAMEKLDKGSTLALAGIYIDSLPGLDYEKHLFHEKQIRSVTASTREDAKGLLEIAAKISLKTEVEEFGFEDLGIALEKLKKSEIRGATVLNIG